MEEFRIDGETCMAELRKTMKKGGRRMKMKRGAEENKEEKVTENKHELREI